MSWHVYDCIGMNGKSTIYIYITFFWPFESYSNSNQLGCVNIIEVVMKFSYTLHVCIYIYLFIFLFILIEQIPKGTTMRPKFCIDKKKVIEKKDCKYDYDKKIVKKKIVEGRLWKKVCE